MIAAFDELCAEPCWVAWRNEMRNGKPNKTPYSPVDGRLAKANDPRTWGTRSSADARAKNIMRNGMGGGTGLEFHDRGDGTALGGIDLDTCRSEDGTIEPWAQEIIDQFASYTEISPSDTGAKIFFKYRAADYPQLWVAIGKKHGRSFKRGTGEHPPAIELHISNRYYAVTERWLESTPDKLVLIETKLLLWLIHEAGPAFVGNGKEHISSLDDRLSSRPRSTDNSRSAVAYCKGTALRAAGLNFEQMCDALRTDPEISEWCREKGNANGARELRRIWDKGESPKQERKEDFDAAPRKEEAEAEDFDAAPAPAEGVSYADFFALMPMHSYIYTPSREMWPGSSVNARLPAIPLGDGKFMSASLWLDRNRPVEQMTWAPGLPMVIKDRLISQGGWIERNGVSCFNLYRPPAIKHGDKTQAEIWLHHGRTIFPDDIDHIVRWLAHRVQRPEEKINHAIVLGGSQGVGKDSLLEPVKRAVGAWNFSEVSPQQLLGRFNGFAKSVILRFSEARDLGDVDRYAFYEHLKVYTAAPPDVLRVDEKNLREYAVPNCCSVIITTNHKTDGLYLPADDRRHFVAWSNNTKEEFSDGYWRDLYGWYDRGGAEHVAAYLASVDLSGFDAKAPPPKTVAFWEIVDASRAPEDAELSDVIDAMKVTNTFTLTEDPPDTLTLTDVAAKADAVSLHDFSYWLRDRKNARRIPHRLEACGYVAVRNAGATDGLWKVGGKRQVIYAKACLSLKDRISAAQARTVARSV